MNAPFRHTQSEVDRLRAENEALREKLAAFERDVLGDILVFPSSWALAPQHAQLLGILLSRPTVRKDAALAAITRFASEPDVKICDQIVCQLRKKLKPQGLAIRTIWGLGYMIEEPMRSEWRQRYMPGATS